MVCVRRCPRAIRRQQFLGVAGVVCLRLRSAGVFVSPAGAGAPRRFVEFSRRTSRFPAGGSR
eukprot:9668466-Lingulodinium_polyedra.AAC.1